MNQLRRTRMDGLPENQIGAGHMADTGCEVSPSCLVCPLPKCRYDVPGGVRTLLNVERNETIRAMRQGGVDAQAIAVVMHVAPRTVWRVLEANR